MSLKDFAERLSRLEAKAPQEQERIPRARPRKRRWPLWAGLIGVALVAAFLFVGTSKPTPTLGNTFTGTSKSVFEGELTTVSYPDHSFQIDIPSDWRQMTTDEIEAAGGSLAEIIDGSDIADFTNAPVGELTKVRFDIFAGKIQETDAMTPVTEFQNILGIGNVLGFFMGFKNVFLTEPTRVEHPSLSVAETTLYQQFPNGHVVGLYRVHIVGNDMIVIYVSWEDVDIHPSAFAPILDSFREL